MLYEKESLGGFGGELFYVPASIVLGYDKKEHRIERFGALFPFFCPILEIISM